MLVPKQSTPRKQHNITVSKLLLEKPKKTTRQYRSEDHIYSDFKFHSSSKIFPKATDTSHDATDEKYQPYRNLKPLNAIIRLKPRLNNIPCPQCKP